MLLYERVLSEGRENSGDTAHGFSERERMEGERRRRISSAATLEKPVCLKVAFTWDHARKE